MNSHVQQMNPSKPEKPSAVTQFAGVLHTQSAVKCHNFNDAISGKPQGLDCQR